jgi:hypothetical protein
MILSMITPRGRVARSIAVNGFLRVGSRDGERRIVSSVMNGVRAREQRAAMRKINTRV